VLAQVCSAQPAPLLDILKAELLRNFSILSDKADPAAYFLSYGVVEQDSAIYGGVLGALQTAERRRGRVIDVSVRVGSRELDNYHSTRGERPRFNSPSLLPLDDEPLEIRRRLWLETDETYRRAAQRLMTLKTSTQVRRDAEDQSADFSKEQPSVYIGAGQRLRINESEWEQKVRDWSDGFRKYPSILASNVTAALTAETRHLVNSENTTLRHGRSYSRIMISAQTKAADGMDLAVSDSFEAETPEDLPKPAVVEAAVDRVARQLIDLAAAPEAEPFVGPAILSGRAAGVFFHEIFGHRIEGHRQRDETDGQTFTKSVGSPVLPEFLSVVFDPTMQSLGSINLFGSYAFDDEGVKAQRVEAVKDGVLKTFLMSRTPVAGFPTSNGHGRKQAGSEVVSRQSNLLVLSKKSVSEDRLRAMLIEEVKKQGKPYGLRFEQVTGGFTTTGRGGFQSFKVIPVIVYRVYPDGRPDELVRGVDIVGTPLASFARIVATSDKNEVFNGYCGAESGQVPVSAASPSLLISEIEVQRKQKSDDRPPILPAPPLTSEVASR
jgi:predicted Zn-dependent protease